MHSRHRPSQLFFSLVACALAACAGPSGRSGRLGPVESSVAACQDGVDNDGDGAVDCADADCLVHGVCAGDAEDPHDVGDTRDASASDGASSDGIAPDAAVIALPCATASACDPSHGIFCVAGLCDAAPDFSPGPSLAEIGAALVGVPARAAARGDEIGEFCGIKAFAVGSSALRSTDLGGYGYAFQSTELAYRYLCQHLGLAAFRTGPYGVARAWFDNLTDPALGRLVRYPSGGAVPPRPGDLLVFDVGAYGHVAIVTRALVHEAGGVVHVLEQGLDLGTHAYRVDVDVPGTFSVAGARGWLRAPDGPVGCGVRAHLAVAQLDATHLAAAFSVHADLGVAAVSVVSLTSAGERVLETRTFTPPEPQDVAFDVALDVTRAGLELDMGHHDLALRLTPPRHPSFPVARAGVERHDGPIHPYRALFAAAAAELDVPACLLMALAEVRSGWNQGRVTARGAVGVMGLAGAQRATAAALLAALPAQADCLDLGAPGAPGACANIRAGAALLAHVAAASGARRRAGAAVGAASALELWWPAVARFDGAAPDGDVYATNFPARVYDALSRGAWGRFPPTPFAPDAVPPPSARGSRPATVAELLAEEASEGDVALAPVAPAFHVRTAEPFSAADLSAWHRCAGPCADADCDEVLCPAEPRAHCVDDATLAYDACGGAAPTQSSCGTQPALFCRWPRCVDGRCVNLDAPAATPCSDGLVCRDGGCAACQDGDGDGFFRDCAPFDCPGHDNDPLIHPGAREVFDVRDNDCDGLNDEDGLLRIERYVRHWSAWDWEHRYAPVGQPPPWAGSPGWEREPGTWLDIYPLDVCTGAYAPADGCLVSEDGGRISLWDQGAGVYAFRLNRLNQCTGVYPETGVHLSLVLSEGGEATDYRNKPGFSCTPLGYVPASWNVAGMEPAATVLVYRHRGGFSDTANAVFDNSWSTCESECAPFYTVHTPAFHALGGACASPAQCVAVPEPQ